MRTRVFVASMLVAMSAVAGEPQGRIDPEPPAGPFEDRSAPSTYRYDSPAYIGAGGAAGREYVGVNIFDALGGSDLLTSVSCVWCGEGNGSTQL
ncbi:MAG: hypothetical protein K2Y21_09930 [Phycisphaerales bacterium]|nr:hypothetical protein [Phycisphaerales bacterium]